MNKILNAVFTRRLGLALLVLLCLAGSAICQETTLIENNGIFWEKLSQETKYGYVQGYLISSIYLTKDTEMSLRGIKRTIEDKSVRRTADKR